MQAQPANSYYLDTEYTRNEYDGGLSAMNGAFYHGDDMMVSDMSWHDDILTDDVITDGWAGVPRGWYSL
jgi:hypothetical protein